MQKQHSSTIDKMNAQFDKSAESTANGESAGLGGLRNGGESGLHAKLKECVEEQTKMWAALIERQQAEEQQLNNEHVDQQCFTFQVLLTEAQKQRKKDIESRQNK